MYNPPSRFRHASILIGSKWYITGGFNYKGKSLSDFFYLDLSNPFSTKNLDTLQYKQLNDNGLTPNAWCNTVTTNNMIYLFGCLMVSDKTSLVYQYSINSDKWINPPIAGTTSPVHRIQNGVVANDSTGRIYYFGGRNDTYKPLNDMWILDTNNNQLSWQQITSAPLQICCFSAILLQDGYILYIGGFSNSTDTRNRFLRNITRYNINSNEWDLKSTKGDSVVHRPGFSAILVPADGRIILYGGVKDDVFTNDLAVLDTTKYEWSLPEVKDKPKPKSYHTACFYDNFMIVAFGILNDDNQPDSGIYLLDLTDKSTYKWVTDFKPNKSIGDGNRNIIIGASIGAVIFSILVSFFSYRFYKKRKRNSQRESSKIAVDDFN
ncbi:uncharacterized protein OCT59_007179 [Rhizophagus irregularis]|uniref:Attractin/MKLN-like beta-propeller domain-containing protein n=2 Tax=Rhizophagus irregularis TaxID=588596 RepID=U9UK35_RHIID|nr:hypothetical protein GLOIN_2v1778992 [Rhizophagus irregularis DAOM 181602=DAOM 197198]EXX52886.1 hypothetical protein RirG_249100 [Rhizophagus irregularis DAOM 197198w]POG67826.1 hypothetical protein GLOIN_2v1778992 [Rhizophagus irregularis DAOM 181602=DAOM 197198]UZO15763.1 hypothetical protein OCT59_007179 [Rhizophagus irregularis]GBC32867.1 hypothetical protein GLOIN_2v1778992 [Rhizophagus irregularis DAOM 181602=DAOM 197198]|eukprot:XP_025174692.1 hypothetical protein GLOIN_2v1778992 [Rhizophagus irregularis DAOM 181602=DAOM 197198]